MRKSLELVIRLRLTLSTTASMTLGVKSFLLTPISSRAQVMPAPVPSALNRSDNSKTSTSLSRSRTRDAEDVGGAGPADQLDEPVGDHFLFFRVPFLALAMDINPDAQPLFIGQGPVGDLDRDLPVLLPPCATNACEFVQRRSPSMMRNFPASRGAARPAAARTALRWPRSAAAILRPPSDRGGAAGRSAPRRRYQPWCGRCAGPCPSRRSCRPKPTTLPRSGPLCPARVMASLFVVGSGGTDDVANLEAEVAVRLKDGLAQDGPLLPDLPVGVPCRRRGHPSCRPATAPSCREAGPPTAS